VTGRQRLARGGTGYVLGDYFNSLYFELKGADCADLTRETLC